VSSISNRVVKSLRVIGYSLIPYENSARFIADPTREVLSFGDVIKKKLENTVGLFLIESDDFLRVDWVDI
jgi:hypothetical protein